jgi:RNA polymerase sigma factor (sigma-70 family)
MDHSIFLKAKSGDKQSIGILIKAYDPTMEKFAAKLCASAEDADDSVQHARLVVAQKLNTFKELSKLSTWLFAIIKNECHRLQKKMFGFSIHGPSEFNWVDGTDLELQIERKQMLDRLARCISQLSPDEIELIILKDVEGRTLVELADHYKLSVPAIKSRLHRSRTELKELLSRSKISSVLN